MGDQTTLHYFSAEGDHNKLLEFITSLGVYFLPTHIDGKVELSYDKLPGSDGCFISLHPLYDVRVQDRGGNRIVQCVGWHNKVARRIYRARLSY